VRKRNRYEQNNSCA